MVVAGLVFVVVGLLVAGALTVRRARSDLPRLSRLWAWGGFALAAVPSVVWLVLWLSGGATKALIGLAGLVLSAAPVAAAYRFPRLVPLALALCLLASSSMVVAWQHLYALLPLSVALTGIWAVTLVLHLQAERRRNDDDRRKTPLQRPGITRP